MLKYLIFIVFLIVLISSFISEGNVEFFERDVCISLNLEDNSCNNIKVGWIVLFIIFIVVGAGLIL